MEVAGRGTATVGSVARAGPMTNGSKTGSTCGVSMTDRGDGSGEGGTCSGAGGAKEADEIGGLSAVRVLVGRDVGGRDKCQRDCLVAIGREKLGGIQGAEGNYCSRDKRVSEQRSAKTDSQNANFHELKPRGDGESRLDRFNGVEMNLCHGLCVGRNSRFIGIIYVMVPPIQQIEQLG